VDVPPAAAGVRLGAALVAMDRGPRRPTLRRAAAPRQATARAPREFAVSAEVVARAMKGARGQITLLPTGSLDYIPLNTAIAPFDDMNVRRAVLAGIDRDALRKV